MPTFTPDRTKSDTERLRAVEDAVAKLATKEDIAVIVQQTLKDEFKEAGRGAKAIIITTATIVGSLVVIAGGIKWILAVIGFTYVK